MKEKEEKKIIKIRLINVVFLLFLIFILIIGINSNKLTTKQKIQEAAQNALSKSNTEYLETDEFVKELNKKLGENNYKLQTSENGYLVKTSSNQTYSVTNKGRTSQLRWTTNESDNKIIDSEGNEYNIGDYIDYNPNITTDSSKIVDFVNPIWETENRNLELNDNNIATVKFTLRGSDTYYASDTIAPGTYNATSEELKKNFEVYVNAKEANSNVKVTIHPGKKLMESRTIDGVTKEVQYGITYEVEIYTATENIEQVKITIPKGTIIDETKNENEEKSFIVFDVLRPTNTEKTEDSKFLNIDGIKRKDIEKITFVKSKSEVIGTNYYDVSAVGSSTIIAGYEDKDGNGKYEVYIGSDFDIYVNRDTSYLFANTGITTIENLNLINTINSLNMEYMFSNCANLQEITFSSKFDTKNVKNMEEMFGGCSTLKNITLNEEFNTNKVTNISKMFQNCINLTTIDLGNNFDTSNVLDASYMFSNCNKLTNIDLKEKFNTEKVTNMSYMFNDCSNLNTINLGEKFDTTQVTNMSYMFNNCSKLASIDLKEKFNTNKVTNISYMFNNCSTLGQLELKEKFYTNLVTDMSYTFNGCSNLSILDLGPAFTNIPGTNEAMLQNTGTAGCIIYCGEAIYSDINNLRLNPNSEVLINYEIGTINCKYKIVWSKYSSSIDELNKTLTLVVKATGDNTTYKETTSKLTKDTIKIYIDEELADDGTNVKKDVTFLKEENGSVYYTITLTDFEQSILQENKPYREWSGNVSIEIDRRQALDIYGNGNLLDTIKDGEIDKNTDGTLYSDFVKPEYIYKYSNTQIDKTNGILTVGFDVVDKYYSSEGLTLQDLILKVYNETTSKWENVNINNVKNSLTKTQRKDGKGITYTLEVKNLEQEMGELYKNYSGYVSIIIPANKAIDLSGNKNIEKTITIGIDEPKGDDKNPVIVDVVKPIWRIENVEIHNKNFEKDLKESYVYVDIIGTDKYYLSNTLTPQDILPIADKEEARDIKVEFEYFKGESQYGVLVTEKREDGNKNYGVKYRVKLSGFEQAEKQAKKEYLEWSGNIDIKISADTLVDKSDNKNIETTLNVGMVDFIKPRIEQIELTQDEKNYDNTNKTKTLKFKAIDKYFDSTENTTLTANDITTYVDGLEANLEKNLTYVDEHKTTNTGVQYVVRTYKLILSKFEQKRTEVNYDREFIDWSGYVTVDIPENTIKDKTGNGNDKTTLIGGDVDYIKPTITYKYITSDINNQNKTFKMTIDITDRYFNENNVLTLDNIGVAQIDGVNLLEAQEKGLVTIELNEISEIENRINGKDIIVGKKYELVFSNLQQDPNNGEDYSGILTIAINSNSIEDKNGLRNINTIITSGIDLPGNKTDGEIVDVVSPYVRRKGLDIDIVNGTIRLSVIASDKYQLNETETITKLQEAINNKKVRLICEDKDITDQEGLNVVLENIKMAEDKKSITFEIYITGITQNPNTVYMFLPSGVVIDEHTNKNKATMFAIVNALKVAYIEKENRYEYKPTDPFLGGPIQRQDIEKIIVENDTKKMKETSTKWSVAASGHRQATGTWNDEDVVWDGEAVIYAWYDETQAPYTVHIGSNYDIDFNVDSSYLFANIGYGAKCKSQVIIENLDRLETGTTVRKMDYMFYNTGYNAMTTFEIPDKFDTTNITSMEGMFEGLGYNKMTTFNIGKNFKTSKVVNMEAMFKNFGNKLTKLDLGDNFNTANVKNTKAMFENCGSESMTQIDMGPMFTSLGKTYDNFATNCGKDNKLTFLAPESIYSNLYAFKPNATSEEKIITNAKINPIYRPEWKLAERTYIKDSNGKISGIKAVIEGKTDTDIYTSEVTNTLTKNDIKVYFDDYEDTDEDLSIEIVQDKTNSNKYTVSITNWRENTRVDDKKYLEWSGNIKLKISAQKLVDKYGNQNLSEIAIDDENATEKYKWENILLKDENMIKQNTEGTMFADIVKPQINYKYSNVEEEENPNIDYITKTVTVEFDVIDKYFKSTQLQTDENANLITVKVDGEEEANSHITKTLTKVEDITDQINGNSQKIGEKYRLVITGLEQPKVKTGEEIADYSGPVQLLFNSEIIEDLSGNKNISKTITIDTDDGDDDDNSVIVDVVDPVWLYKISSIDRNSKTVTLQITGSDKYYDTNNLMENYENKIKVLMNGEEINTITKELRKISEDSQKVVYELTLGNFEKNEGVTQIVIPTGTITDKYGNTNKETTINVGNPNWTEAGDTDGKYDAFSKNIVDFTKPSFTYKYSGVSKTANPDINYKEKVLTVGFKLNENYVYENLLKEGNELSIDNKKIRIKVDGTDITEQLKINLNSSNAVNGVKDYVLNISNFELDKILDGEEYKNYSGPVQLIFEKGLVTDTSGNQNLATTITIDYDDGDDEDNPLIVDVVDPIWSYYNSSIDRNNNTVEVQLKGTDKYLSKDSLTANDIDVFIDGTKIPTIQKQITKVQSNNTSVTYKVVLSNFEEYSGKTQIQLAPNTLEDTSGNKNILTMINVGNTNWVEDGDSEGIYTAFKENVVDFIKPEITYHTSSIDRTNKTVELQIKLSDKQYFFDKLSKEKNGKLTYNTSYIHVYVKDVEKTEIAKQLNLVEETETYKIYKLILGNFGTNDREVKISVDEGTLLDTSGNKNEETIIYAGNPDWKDDDGFNNDIVDFIQPEITYIYEKDQSPIINKENKTVTFKFKVTDTNYARNTFEGSSLEIKIDGKLVGENITRTYSTKEILDDENRVIGLEYTVVLSNFEIERQVNEPYTRYSGTLEITIPEGKFFDSSGNSNNSKYIIICEDKETENIKDATIIDFVDPKIYTDNNTVVYDYVKQTATISFETSDRFFKTNKSEKDEKGNNLAIIDKDEIRIIDDNGDDVTDTLDWKLSTPIFTNYGYKYSITIQDYVDEFKFSFIFKEGSIYDENGRYNEETTLTYMVDDVKPRIKYKGINVNYLDNQSYSATVNVETIDRYLDLENSHITTNDVKVYRDGEDVTSDVGINVSGISKVTKIPRSMTFNINLSKLSVTGTYSLVFNEGIMIDEEKNKNIQTTMTFSKSAIKSTNYEEIKYFVDEDVIYVNELLNINETGENNATVYTPSTIGELYYEGKNSNFSEKYEYTNGTQNAQTFFAWVEADSEGNYIYYKDSSYTEKYKENDSNKENGYLRKFDVYDEIPGKIHYLKAMWQKANVVFVSGSKGNDNNNGLSTGTAVKTIGKALEKLSSSGTTKTNYIVVTDEVTLNNTINKNVTITSLYGGKDYQHTNNAKLKISSNINLQADVVFDNIKIDSESSTISNGKQILANENFTNLLIGNYHNITLGRRISSSNGKYSFGAVIGGNYKTESNKGEIGRNKIIIESGTYNDIIVGSSISESNKTSNSKYVTTTLQIGSKKDGTKAQNTKLTINGYLMLGQNETNCYSYEAVENDNYTNMYSKNYATIELHSGTFTGNNLYSNSSENSAIYLRSINSTTEGNVLFKMYGGQVNGNIYAGARTINSNTDAVVTNMYFYGGNIISPNGGIFGQGANESFYGGSRITLTGITQINGSVYGGSNVTIDGKGNGTANTEINVTGSSVKISGNIYGGSKYSQNTENEVTGIINGNTNINIAGTIDTNVYGGGYNTQVSDSTNINISGTLTGDLFGGAYQSYVKQSTNIITTGNLYGNIYGGGENTSNGTSGVGYKQNSEFISGTININIKTGTIGKKNTSNNIYGGSKNQNNIDTDKFEENSYITIGSTEGSPIIYNTIYGGGINDKLNSTNIEVIGNNRNSYLKIYGASNANSVIKTSNITTNGGYISEIYGSGNTVGSVDTTNITLDRSTVQNVYGAGNRNSAKTTNIIAKSGNITNIYGGGKDLDTAIENTNISVLNGNITNIYGAGLNNGAGRTNINVNVSTRTSRITNIYGGAKDSGNVNETNVNILNGSVNNVYGGNQNGGYTINSKVNIQKTAEVKNKLFAGGQNTDIGTSSTNGNAILNITGGTIYCDVNGGSDLGKVYGNTFVNIGKEVAQIETEKINSGNINIQGDIFGGGTSEYSQYKLQYDNSQTSEYNFDKVTSVEGNSNINIDGKSTITFANNIYGTGNASTYSGTSNITIENFGIQKNVKEIKSIQRASNLYIGNSWLEIDGKQDILSASNRASYSLNKIDSVTLYKASAVHVQSEFNLVKEFNSYVDKEKTQKATAENVINRLYTLEALNLVIAKQETYSTDEITEFGDVNGLTFFGMYAFKHSGNSNDKTYDIYDPITNNAKLGTGNVFVQGAYVQGKRKDDHDLYVDGFYTNMIHNKTEFSENETIIPYVEGRNDYQWIIGINMIEYNVALTGSVYSRQSIADVKLDFEYLPNAKYTISKVSLNALKKGIELVDPSKIKEIADSTDIANSQFGLSIQTTKEGNWTQDTSNNIYTADEGGVKFNGITFDSDSSSTPPTLRFKMYNSLNITKNQNLGRINLILLGENINEESGQKETFLVVVSVDLKTVAEITNTKYVAMFKDSDETTRNYTSNSKVDLTYRLFYNSDYTIYDDNNDKRAVSSTMKLPAGTKLTVMDTSNPSSKTYYRIIHSEDGYDEVDRDKAGNITNYIYYLENFTEMGAVENSVKYNDKSNGNSNYYHVISGTTSTQKPENSDEDTTKSYAKEDFELLVDFAETNITQDFAEQDIHIELRHNGTVKYGQDEENKRTFNIWSDASKKATMNFEVIAQENNNAMNPTYTNLLNITASLTGAKVSEEENGIVLDTQYFDKVGGIAFELVDLNGNKVDYTKLSDFYIEETRGDETVRYNADMNGIVSFNITSGYSFVNKKYTVNIVQKTLSTGKYKLKVTYFFSDDGKYYASETKKISYDEIEIVVINTNIVNIGITQDNSNRVFTINKNTKSITDMNEQNSGINLNVKLKGAEEKNSVRVELFKRQQTYNGKNYNEPKYSSIDFNTIFTTNNTLTKKDNEYILIPSCKSDNISIDFNAMFKTNVINTLPLGEYKIVFKVYYEDYFVQEISKTFIITQ